MLGWIVGITIAAMLLSSWAGGEAEKRGDWMYQRAAASAVGGGWIVLGIVAMLFLCR